MPRFLRTFLLLAICVAPLDLIFAQNINRNAGQAAQIARGRYIVEGLARCGQCHTPLNSDGTLDRTHQLEGAAVRLVPSQPSSDWPLVAPRIAGTLPASDEDMQRLLTTGLWTNRKPLRAPMPQFRMTQEDAQAVIAFLRSLTPAQ